MSIFRRIVAVFSLPAAFLMLVTGLSPVTKSQQEKKEAAVEAEVQEDFAPVFRFAVATDVHISADDDTNTKIYPMIFDIYIRACNEDLYAYFNSVDAGSDGSVYTNIEGGLGIFAARRTHIYRRVPGDPSDRPGIGLHALLRDSIPGFI